jgi:hypothetical protein
MGERHGGTYSLIVNDRGRDQSVFSVGEKHNGTYILIVDNRGKD